MNLTLVCVSQGAPRAVPFLAWMSQLAADLGAQFVLGADRCALSLEDPGPHDVVLSLESQGIVEQVLNQAMDACVGDYVLRLDDDEICSPEMVTWLAQQEYLARDSWFFPRFALWPDRKHLITTEPFFPDFQQRLTVRAKAKRPPTIHSASPWEGWLAPVAIEHHAFIVKTYAERQALTAHYESVMTGKHFNPEDANVVAPEDWRVVVEPVKNDALIQRAKQAGYWRASGTNPPEELQRELDAWAKREGLL